MAPTATAAAALVLLLLAGPAAAQRPPDGVPCSATKRRTDPGCEWCSRTLGNLDQCLSCKPGAYLPNPINNLCGCAPGYGSVISGTVVNPPPNFPINNCVVGGALGSQCMCRACPAGLMSEGGPLNSAVCDVAVPARCSAGLLSVGFDSNMEGLPKIFQRFGDLRLVLAPTDPDPSMGTVFHATDRGLLLGNDCTNELRSFTVDISGLAPGKLYSVYSVYVGQSSLDPTAPVAIELSGQPQRCLSRSAPVTAARTAPASIAPGKMCALANGDVLTVTISYTGGPDAATNACSATTPKATFVRVSSIILVPQ